MKTIKFHEYQNDGVFINLETTFVPYENLLHNHYRYLDKKKKYYFYCKSGKKAKKVALILEAYGYDTTLVLNDV